MILKLAYACIETLLGGVLTARRVFEDRGGHIENAWRKMQRAGSGRADW